MSNTRTPLLSWELLLIGQLYHPPTRNSADLSLIGFILKWVGGKLINRETSLIQKKKQENSTEKQKKKQEVKEQPQQRKPRVKTQIKVKQKLKVFADVHFRSDCNC